MEMELPNLSFQALIKFNTRFWDHILAGKTLKSSQYSTIIATVSIQNGSIL